MCGVTTFLRFIINMCFLVFIFCFSGDTCLFCDELPRGGEPLWGRKYLNMLKVFYVKLPECGWNPEMERFFQPLADDTVFRDAMGFRSDKVRLTRLIGVALIRLLLLRFFGLAPGDYTIVRNIHGKPFLEGRNDVFFNISHSGDYVVCALSDKEVGIDIEGEKRARLEVARRFFHPDEIKKLESLEDKEKDDFFYDYWSVKESFLKYTGDGLTRPLSSFCVRFDREETGIYEDGRRLPLFVSTCDIASGYKCYVCSGSGYIETVTGLDWSGLDGKSL